MRTSLAALALALLGGCANAPPVIDGWEIGEPVNCGSEVPCNQYAQAATNRLDRVAPGHAPIVSIEVRDQARIHARSGGSILVVVLRMADGSTRAFGVGHAGIEPGLAIFGPPLD